MHDEIDDTRRVISEQNLFPRFAAVFGAAQKPAVPWWAMTPSDFARSGLRNSSHARGARHVIGYDHLLLALGSVTNFFGIPGVAEHSLTIKTLGDAVRLRNRVLDMLESAELEDDAAKRRSLLSFVVVGAGLSGLAAEERAAASCRESPARRSCTRSSRAADLRSVSDGSISCHRTTRSPSRAYASAIRPRGAPARSLRAIADTHSTSVPHQAKTLPSSS